MVCCLTTIFVATHGIDLFFVGSSNTGLQILFICFGLNQNAVQPILNA